MWRFTGLLWIAFLWGGDVESLSKVTKKNTDIVMKTYSESINCTPGKGNTSTCYYRYLMPDEEEKRLYVGAMNFIIVLDLDNVSRVIQRKELLPDKSQENICSIQVRQIPDCQNHIRVITKLSAARLLVCGTGAYSPQKYELNVSDLSQSSLSTPERSDIQNFSMLVAFLNGSVSSSGVGLCPFDPFDNASSIYITNGNPSNIPSHYTGTYTNFVKTFPVIYRPQLNNGSTIVVPTVISEKDNENWLKSPQFAASFDVDNRVYFFFREEAVEFQNCEEKKIVSRVAKVCKKDTGTSLSQRYWLSYQKARLLCTVPGFNPDYFDDIQDVSYVNEDIFYALFTKVAKGVKASAICAYKKKAIEDVFAGKYKYKENGLWKELPKSLEPKPRSVNVRRLPTCGDAVICLETQQCSIYDEAILLLNTETAEYLKYQLMNDEVQPENGQPIFYSSNLVLNKIITVFNITGKDDTLFLVSSNEGSIYKIVLDNRVSPVPKAVVLIKYEVYPDHRSIWNIKLVNSTLYVGSDKSVDQFNLDDCNYTSIDVCGEDPYCVWCDLCYGKCVPATMDSNCKDTFRISAVPSGMDVHRYLNETRQCQLYSVQEQYAVNQTYSVLKINYRLTISGTVKWQLNNVDVDIGNDFLLSTDNSLVIKNLNKSKTGTYTAMEVLEGIEHQIAQYKLQVEEDELTAWKNSFAMWSLKFMEYQGCLNQLGCCPNKG